MADANGKWKRQGVIPVSRRPPEGLAEPIYASLLTRWSAQGRTVPGRPDQEWNSLVAGDCWPRH
ncbi:hypothetical protein [Streptomyces sp. G45]|uniref:hypothetical protein n=1 Tax=Streptomyces sp. G45 TaxID=3406627 RepID=UPI003C204042